MNPWKYTAIGMALVIATAVITGLVVANRSPESDQKVAAPAPAPAASPRTAPARVAQVTTAPSAPAAPSQPAYPTQAVVDACNQYATSQGSQNSKTHEVVKDTAVGALIGAAVGAAGGAIADGGKGAGKGAAIGGVLGGGGGALYGVNENKKHDEQYRNAYSSCLRSRGYAG